MKLTESLELAQQQTLIDAILKAAVAQSIIKEDTIVNIDRPEMILHLVDCLGEAWQPRKKIVMFKDGVIHPTGRCAWLTLSEDHPDAPRVNTREIKSSVPVTPYVEGVDELSWFETLNTIYIMSPDGKPLLDMRGVQPQSES